MKIATTTADFNKYANTHEEKIALLHECGFKHIDLSFYGKEDNLPFLENNWIDYARSLKEFAKNKGMDFVQAHSLGGNPLVKNANHDFLLQSTIRSIEVCGILEIPNIVVHAGWKAGIGKEEYFEQNLAFFEQLYPAMEKSGVNVLIENSCKSNMGENWYFLNGSDMRDFIAYSAHPQLFACWDTGHANVEGHQYDDMVSLGKNLKAIHFNDNRGFSDEHILPYMGTMSIDEIMNGLVDIGFDGAFTFECDNSIITGSDWPNSRKAFPKDTRAFKPSLELKMQVEKLMYSLGVEILEKYNITAE